MPSQEALEYFEYRLKDAKENGANFRVPVDWQHYGPLFLALFKAVSEVLQAGVYGPEGFILRDAADAVDAQMVRDLNR